MLRGELASPPRGAVSMCRTLAPLRATTKVRTVVVLAFVSALGASCVDTELSVDLQVEGGELVVAADGSLDATVELEIRVGTYALSGDDVSLSRIGVFAPGADGAAAELVPMRPEGFDSRIEPGERRRVTVRSTAPADAFPSARAMLCGASSATALVTWTAEQQPDDPLDPPLMSFGSSEGAVVMRCL
ncbi:MAG: hypothetical protein MUE69_08865 [Myxococcota bacterium]|nr:hypothetical protein [Myxococcota bacterium]